LNAFRLGIVSTHPIQYLVPLYRALADMPGLELEVFYLSRFAVSASFDAGFSTSFAWDLDLTSGYRSTFLDNRAAKPSPRFWGSDCPDLSTVIARSRLDGVLIPGIKCRGYLQTLRAAQDNRVPILYRGESGDHERRTPLKRWTRDAFLRRLYQRCAAFLAIGVSTREHYLRLGIDDSAIFASPFAVDNARFLEHASLLEPERARLRQEWNLPLSAVVALLPGKMVAKKGHRMLLEAASRVVGQGLWLLFGGDGPLRGEIVELARELRFDRYRITGFLNQQEIGRAYAAADFVVLPSQFAETWGLVVNEGMLFGLPAIVSDQVGCRFDLVRDGETGRIFPATSRAGLTDRLEELLHDLEGCRAMGQRAKRLVSDGYSVRRAADGIWNACRYVRTGSA
jgi:glycosyltransferase involved in cell wall biosynthesis